MSSTYSTQISPRSNRSIDSYSSRAEAARDQALLLLAADTRLSCIPPEHYVDASSIFICEINGGEDYNEFILGEGGQGTIFKATIPSQGTTPMAVKVSQSLTILEEYATATRFNHPRTPHQGISHPNLDLI